ncbi:DUF4251 domain-containing protein [Prolixibacteraceae bacterium Z1-6]|uniref:DUF4251 domain-containing protein n=1 Tax=Draconibacterium aestuarii TaxID=2998507 RepID=A0A9X3J769_9BACT|nr:DUF4251 domain-containing protein [Prolixibacteraceae bacterium Z1-6]
MKNIILIMLLMFSVVALDAQEVKKSKKEKRTEREAKLVEQTKKLVEAETWQFDARQMLPARGRSRNLNTPYNVQVKDGEVDSYLPYFGVAHSAPYGSTDSPMIFKAPVEDYRTEEGKKGGYIIKFKAKNKNDLVEYTFNISSNGSTSLSVNSTNRQYISYHGDLVPVKEKKEKN